MNGELQRVVAEPLSRDEFYVPMSILEARVDTRRPLAYGIDDAVDLLFNQSPVFRIDDAGQDSVHRIAWFDSASPLRSGWARGEEHLSGGAAMIQEGVLPRSRRYQRSGRHER